MQAQGIYDVALGIAEQLPGAEIYQAFPMVEACRVAGKWFAVVTAKQGVQVINVKIDPAEGAYLRQNYAQIKPAYHMNKQHWISIYPTDQIGENNETERAGDTLDAGMIRDLIVDSYLLIISRLPVKLRPIESAAELITVCPVSQHIKHGR